MKESGERGKERKRGAGTGVLDEMWREWKRKVEEGEKGGRGGGVGEKGDGKGGRKL